MHIVLLCLYSRGYVFFLATLAPYALRDLDIVAENPRNPDPTWQKENGAKLPALAVPPAIL